MKKSITLTALSCLILFLFSNCAGNKSIVTGSKVLDEKIEKLFVYIPLKTNKSYSKKIGQELANKLTPMGLDNEVFFREELDLINEKEIQRKINTFGATHIMSITTMGSSVEKAYSFEQKSSLSYEIIISNAQTGKQIWNGGILFMVGLNGSREIGPALDQLIKQLKRDGII
ncbi:hypothetical protein [Dysgonomonas sp.]